jgi:hypothetical protein
MPKTLPPIATTAFGLEGVTKRELAALGHHHPGNWCRSAIYLSVDSTPWIELVVLQIQCPLHPL